MTTSEADEWPGTLSYWRTFTAEQLDDNARAEVATCINSIYASPPEWDDAIRGDSTAATALVLALGAPAEIGPRVDLAMTVLMKAAFEDAGAALAFANALQRMPLESTKRTELAASWMLHNVWLEARGPKL